ncbi:SIMPL domain-containing protein [Propionivibrio soli]|uniref:SIMPL domain-containing protein n=1 Tax=Propionivibrio soli TaxID=2976531 RepID=UPI0021E77E21|nr:SIMPL domain-containing protein [Propionivibrio soli]
MFYRILRNTPQLFLPIRALPLLAIFAAAPVVAEPTIVELAAEASRPAANDLVRAVVSAEAAGVTPGELAAQVNSQIANALRIANGYASVKTQSGGTNTYPVYAKNGKIESWRMRSQLALESRDTGALSELLGKLQATLGVSNLVMEPSPETRKKAEDAAMLDALAAFRERANVLASALGKPYRIKQISVNTDGRIVQPMFRAAPKTMASEIAPMPVEAGESQISVSVSGQVELQ